MRSRYITNEFQNFLPENYDFGILSTFSDDDNRTIESALTHLLGLYPFGTGPEISSSLYP